MAGLDLLEMPAKRIVPVVYSLMVDETYNPAEESRSEGRRKVDEWLDEMNIRAANRARGRADDETWGLLPEHQTGLDNAMQMASEIGGVS